MVGRPPRLTAPAVRWIRGVYAERKRTGATTGLRWRKAVCRRYDISASTIEQICRRSIYRWVQP